MDHYLYQEGYDMVWLVGWLVSWLVDWLVGLLFGPSIALQSSVCYSLTLIHTHKHTLADSELLRCWPDHLEQFGVQRKEHFKPGGSGDWNPNPVISGRPKPKPQLLHLWWGDSFGSLIVPTPKGELSCSQGGLMPLQKSACVVWRILAQDGCCLSSAGLVVGLFVW